MLSVAIITKNEEENIRDALESVKWANEIVVVDSFSADRTVEICREYTDKVYSFEWAGFSEQKNKAVSMTTQPWVFVLDADERVTEELKDEILNVVKNAYPSPTPLPDTSGEGVRGVVDGYYLPRKNYFARRWIKHGGWWPDYTMRLFRREKGLFETREVHESIKVIGSTGYLKNPIEHYTYKDIDDYLKRMQTYSTLAAKELFKKGCRGSILDIIFRPPATFFKMFFLQLGILDGIYGIILAYLYSVYTYKKYWKLRELRKQNTERV
ncbi:MAG TPA: glycosyltransferase family 2 protein [Thermodesulfovibrionia bacterium]|nr:glycosyltransferase family 2 protein [Thermodesulfovibrionia bacterium]